MRSPLLLSLALLAALSACKRETPATATPEPAAPAAPAAPEHAFAADINAADFSELVKTLASDEFEGRGPGTPGEDKTVDYIKAQNLSATGLTVTYDGATSTVSVFGVAPDQATKEKIALCCGNVAGVAKVNNMMSVDQSAPEATYYTVVSGDTLSKISKTNYGDPNKYMVIFEANKPMLSDPNKIYPGQVLRIPPP